MWVYIIFDCMISSPVLCFHRSQCLKWIGIKRSIPARFSTLLLYVGLYYIRLHDFKPILCFEINSIQYICSSYYENIGRQQFNWSWHQTSADIKQKINVKKAEIFKAIIHFRNKQINKRLIGLTECHGERLLLKYCSMKCFTFWENIKTI